MEIKYYENNLFYDHLLINNIVVVNSKIIHGPPLILLLVHYCSKNESYDFKQSIFEIINKCYQPIA